MSYTIDNSAPLPARRNRYPFAEMQPGQSFPIPTQEEAKKVRNAAYQYARKSNEKTLKDTGVAGTLKFSLRKLEDGSFRLWRVDGTDGAAVATVG